MERNSGQSLTVKRQIWYALALVGFLSGAFVLIETLSPTETHPLDQMTELECEDEPIELKFGFDTREYHVKESRLQKNQFLESILSKANVDYGRIFQLDQTAKDIFDFKRLRPEKKYALLSKDTCMGYDFFVYEPDPYSYIVCHLNDPIEVRKVSRPVVKQTRSASGIIKSSLWNSMEESGLSWGLIEQMENALAWTVDFYHLQKGDEYKLIFEEHFVEGKRVGIGELKAAVFKQNSKEHYALKYKSSKYDGYYDLDGRATTRAFLKSPVKYARISSGYNLRRYHPVLKRVRPHLGTDYAAPHGTPIYSVANGTVTKVGFTRGNGKFVKIRHDKVYESQYLHMSRFAKGLRRGDRVSQGQVIGYVGQTGLATGPHVCFRFWKNGRQVNHRRLNFPPPEPLPQDELEDFMQYRDQYLSQLESVSYKSSSSGLMVNKIDSVEVSP